MAIVADRTFGFEIVIESSRALSLCFFSAKGPMSVRG
jgi:hypothetical protein